MAQQIRKVSNATFWFNWSDSVGFSWPARKRPQPTRRSCKRMARANGNTASSLYGTSPPCASRQRERLWQCLLRCDSTGKCVAALPPWNTVCCGEPGRLQRMATIVYVVANQHPVCVVCVVVAPIAMIVFAPPFHVLRLRQVFFVVSTSVALAGWPSSHNALCSPLIIPHTFAPPQAPNANTCQHCRH